MLVGPMHRQKLRICRLACYKIKNEVLDIVSPLNLIGMYRTEKNTIQLLNLKMR